MSDRVASLRWWLQLIILFTVVISIGGLPAVFTDPIPVQFLKALYFYAAYLTQNFLMSFLLGLLLLPFFLYVKSDRLKIIGMILPVTAFLLFFIASAKVFSFWRFYVNGVIFDLFFDKGGRTNVFQISQQMYVVIALAVVVCLLFSAFLLVLAKKTSNKKIIKPFFAWFFVLYVIVQAITLGFVNRQDFHYLQYLVKSPYFEVLSWANILDHVGVPVFPKKSLSAELRKALSQHEEIHYPLHQLNYQPPKKPLNVLFIVVDTLRYDMVNAVNMPNVYQFAQSSDQFVNHISGGDCTRAGIFTLFYGIPVSYWDSVYLHHQGAITIRAFQDNGYQMAIYGSAGLMSPPFDRTVFVSIKNLQRLVPGKTPWSRDKAMTKEMQSFLDKHKNSAKPFFGFMFYDAPHAYNALDFKHPFSPAKPMNYLTVNNDTNPLPIYRMYQNAVFATDRLINHVLNTLKKDGLMQNTVVIITSDHGQEFNEYRNNYWEHPSGYSKYQLRTPLIIAWPGHKPARYTYLTTHFDVAPTLLQGVLGVTNPVSDYSIGANLYRPHEVGGAIIGRYGHYGLVTKNWIMPFQTTGMYRFTDTKMHPLQSMPLDNRTRQTMFQQMRWFRG